MFDGKIARTIFKNKLSLIPIPPGRGSISTDTDMTACKNIISQMPVPDNPNARYTKGMMKKQNIRRVQMIGFWDYTVILTYISLVSAVSGIFCALSSHIDKNIISQMPVPDNPNARYTKYVAANNAKRWIKVIKIT